MYRESEYFMGVFVNAIKQGNVSYGMGEQIVDASYNLGDGSHKVTINSSNTNVTTGNGNSIIKHYGSNASIETGDGNQTITSIGDNKSISTGAGDDDIVFIGDNCDIELKDGDNSVVFWGDNCNITTGNGDDSITTFDQVYQQGNYQTYADVFIDKLPTGTWENWTKVSSDLIDYKCQKSFFKKKQTWVYEEHYDVETIFSRYINGVQNTNIDMGDGYNTANVTMGSGSQIGGSGTNDITYNEKWQIDESLGHRDEVKLRTDTKKNTRWGNVALAVVGATAAVACVAFAPTIGAAITSGASATGGAISSGAAAVGSGIASAGTAVNGFATGIGTAMGLTGGYATAAGYGTITAGSVAIGAGTKYLLS